MKIYDKLYKLSYILNRQALYLEIKSHIEDKKFIKIMTLKDRMVGKTYVLCKLSKKYHIPVLVPTIRQAMYVKEKYKGVYVITPDDLRGRQYEAILVDDMQLFNFDIITYLAECCCRIIGIHTNDITIASTNATHKKNSF